MLTHPPRRNLVPRQNELYREGHDLTFLEPPHLLTVPAKRAGTCIPRKQYVYFVRAGVNDTLSDIGLAEFPKPRVAHPTHVLAVGTLRLKRDESRGLLPVRPPIKISLQLML